MRSRPLVVAMCASLAAATLFLPAALTFDSWSWLVWGREIGRLDLDTTGGPSWKPLPVAFTTVVAPLGWAAVPVWLAIARTGTLLALVVTYRLGTRVAGPVAGLVAAGLLVLAPDGDPRFLRLLAEGHVAPWSVACALFAVEMHLDGRRSGALVLGFAASLLRPEAWPFFAAYALWMWWSERERRPLVAAMLALVPVLWFGFDWWGSGSPLHGAETAQVAAGASIVERTGEAIAVAATMVAAPVWIAAAVGVASARRRHEAWLSVAAAGAVAWTALVIAMATVFGYAALSRFFLPSAAVACVLAGVGVVRLLRAPLDGRRRVVAIAVVALAALLLIPRVVGVPSVIAEAADRAPVEDDLDAVLDAVGRDRLLSCGALAVDGVGLLRTAVAWKLDVPQHRVTLDLGPSPTGVMVMRSGGPRDEAISRQDHTTPIVRSTHWVALAIDCDSAVPDS
ncbi:MAG: hypothetical protein OSA99_02250 [Acidimicrobiales bacterium]|nr:hypothetical protein [Acidimicrobiales bacterium]